MTPLNNLPVLVPRRRELQPPARPGHRQPRRRRRRHARGDRQRRVVPRPQGRAGPGALAAGLRDRQAQVPVRLRVRRPPGVVLGLELRLPRGRGGGPGRHGVPRPVPLAGWTTGSTRPATRPPMPRTATTARCPWCAADDVGVSVGCTPDDARRTDIGVRDGRVYVDRAPRTAPTAPSCPAGGRRRPSTPPPAGCACASRWTRRASRCSSTTGASSSLSKCTSRPTTPSSACTPTGARRLLQRGLQARPGLSGPPGASGTGGAVVTGGRHSDNRHRDCRLRLIGVACDCGACRIPRPDSPS